MNEIDKLGIPLGVDLLKINTFDSGSFIRRRTIHSNSAHSTMLSIITRRSSFTRITALFTTVIPTTNSAGTTNRSSTTMTTNKSTDHIINDNIPPIPATLLINRERTNVLSPLLNVSPIKATNTLTDKKPVAYNSLDFNILHQIKRQIEHQQKYELSKFHKRVFDYDFEELDNNVKEEDKNPSRDMRQIYTHRLGLPLVGAVLFTSINFCKYVTFYGLDFMYWISERSKVFCKMIITILKRIIYPSKTVFNFF